MDIKERRKQYYLNNREKILEKSKQYYHDNKEEILEKSKQYYHDNKDKILEKSNNITMIIKKKDKNIIMNIGLYMGIHTCTHSFTERL